MAGTMAEATQVQSLMEEATCSLCLKYFRDPVSVECGHTFCLSCITQFWEGLQTHFHCPQCGTSSQNKTLVPNRQMANVVEIAKKIHRSSVAAFEDTLCLEHKEVLKLFCKEDQKPICVVCRESRLHKAHTVLPLEEAAQEYKIRFQKYIEPMKRKLEYILGLQVKEETKVTKVMDKFKGQRERILCEFDSLQKFLEKEKSCYLRSLEEEEKEILQKIKANASNLQGQHTCLWNQITDIEIKCKLRDVELLKDVKSILNKYDDMKVAPPESESSEEEETEDATEEATQEDGTDNEEEEEEEAEVKETEKEKGEEGDDEEEDDDEDEEEEDEEEEQSEDEEVLDDPGCIPSFCKQHLDLQKKIIDSLEWRWVSSSFAGRVTLDAETVNHRLSLSEEGRRVKCIGTWQHLADNPKRFTGLYPCVLGKQGYTSGRHYWELRLLQEPGWCVGVARESVSRKQQLTQSPECGIWALSLGNNGHYTALTTPRSALCPRQRPVKLGVYLDYEGGRVSMYNAETMELIFTFISAAFNDRVFPYFCLWNKTDIHLE